MRAFDESTFPRNGRQLIEASAGTGKTTTLMSLAVRALAEGVPTESLLLITFTNASTRELRLRLRERICDEIKKRSGTTIISQEQLERLNRAHRHLHQVRIQTIHGFATQLISEYGFVTKEILREIVEDTTQLQTEAALDVYRQLLRTDPSGLASTVLGSLEHFLDQKKLAFKNTQKWIPYPKKLPDLSRIREEYNDRLTTLTKSLDALLKMDNIQKAAALRHLSAFKQAQFPWQIPPTPLKYFKMRKETLIENDLDNWLTIAEPTPTMRTFRAFATLQIRKRYLELLNARGIDDPDQLIEKAMRISCLIPKLEKPEHEVVLIDEFQDTDRHQWMMLDNLYPNTANRLFVMVGDPKQAIYRFRGADTVFYRELTSQFSTDQCWSLDVVYRSADGVVCGLNSLFDAKYKIGQDLNYRKLVAARSDEISTLILDGQPLTGFQWTKLTSPDDVVHTLKTILWLGSNGRLLCAGKPIESSDIAILVRDRNIAKQIKQIGDSQGIFCHFQDRSTSVFQKPICQDFSLILEAVAYPNDLGRVVNAAATSIAGFDLQSPHLFLDDPNFEEFQKRLFQAYDNWISLGPTRAIAELLAYLGIETRIENSYQGLEEWTDLTHALEFFGQTAKDLNPKEASTWWMARGYNDYEVNEAERTRLPIRRGVVQLLTIHGSKGLEFPVVMVTGKLKAKLPNSTEWGFDYVTNEGLIVDFSSEASERWLEDGLSDLSRLIYVALTRSKYGVFIGYPESEKDSGIFQLLDGRSPDLLGPNHSIWHHMSSNAQICPAVIPKVKLPKLSKSAQTQSFFRSFSNIFKSDPFQNKASPADDEVYIDVLDCTKCQKWHSLPGGSATGNFIHQILEWDAGEIHEIETRVAYIHQNWPTHIDRGHAPLIAEWIEAIRQVPIHGTYSLASLKPAQKRAEPKFELLLKADLSVTSLIQEFNHLHWYQVPKNMIWGPLKGHLLGFIDLVFELEGRFHVLDYKTNTLGQDDSAYSHTAINHQMHHSQYTAQGAIYGLALHKWLEMKLDDYDPQKHLGNVIYLFCRGITGPCKGVWSQKLDGEVLSKISKRVFDAPPN